MPDNFEEYLAHQRSAESAKDAAQEESDQQSRQLAATTVDAIRECVSALMAAAIPTEELIDQRHHFTPVQTRKKGVFNGEMWSFEHRGTVAHRGEGWLLAAREKLAIDRDGGLWVGWHGTLGSKIMDRTAFTSVDPGYPGLNQSIVGSKEWSGYHRFDLLAEAPSLAQSDTRATALSASEPLWASTHSPKLVWNPPPWNWSRGIVLESGNNSNGPLEYGLIVEIYAATKKLLTR